MAYVVHEFQSGEVLMAGQLNEMDAQIASNESAASDRSYIAAAYSVAPYSKGSLVVYGGEIWEAVVDITVAEAWNSVHWKRATLNDRLKEQDQMVVVQDATPSSYVTKVWLPATPPSGIQVPTYSEFEDMDDEITDLKTAKDQLVDPVTGAFNAGIARKIISDQYTINKAPFDFRKAFDADFLEDKITGGTVVWNQLVQSGNFVNLDGWSYVSFSATLSGGVLTLTASENTTTSSALIGNVLGTINGHKYIVSAGVKYDDAPRSNVWIGSGGYSGCTTNVSQSQVGTWFDFTGLFEREAGGNDKICFYPRFNGSGTVHIKNVQCFDLTAMFGSTIADYIYSLEQATAGAGVAWFRNLFPNSYYAYNAGTLESVQASARKVVGFNQWDEQWENGSISGSTGANQTDSDCIRSKNYMKCIPGETYAGCALSKTGQYVVRMLFYDSSKQFISAGSWFPYATTIAPANANYFRISTQAPTGVNLYGGTYQNDICINISDSSLNGTYKPYESKTYPLDSALVLRGIPKLDSGNNLYYDGDVYEADGTVTRRYGIVDLGSLTWKHRAEIAQGIFSSTGITDYKYSNTLLSICGRYTNHGIVGGVAKMTSAENQSYAFYYVAGTSGAAIYIKDTSYSDAATFKTAVTGTYLVYELATPTTAEADPYNAGQLCFPDGTEEYIDAGVTATTPTRDVSIPVGGERKYYKDFRREVREMIAELQALVLEN